MRGKILTLLFVTWPSLQALFVVKSDQESYDGEVHNKITMGCRFSSIPNVSQLSVIWRRIDPIPILEVYHLEMGQEKSNLINKHFHSRVRLLKEELQNFRAVIEISQLRLNDSGIYRCIVIQDDADYKQTKLNIRAPYKAIKKSIIRRSENKVELSCESQGFPLARVTWRDGKFMESYLTNHSENSHTRNSDGIYVVNSRVSVTDYASNYTCSYVTDDGQPSQIGTFVIPDEISDTYKLPTGYAAATVIVLLCVGLIIGLLILRRRKKALTHLHISSATCESPGPDLRVTSSDYLFSNSDSRVNTLTFTSELCIEKTENLQDRNLQKQSFPLPHTHLARENQDVLTDLRENYLIDEK